MAAVDLPVSWLVWKTSARPDSPPPAQAFGYWAKLREIWWMLARSDTFAITGSTPRAIVIGLYLSLLAFLVLFVGFSPLFQH